MSDMVMAKTMKDFARDAYAKALNLGDDQQLEHHMITRASRELQRMIKTWGTEGPQIALRRIVTILTSAAQSTYPLDAATIPIPVDTIVTATLQEAVTATGTVPATGFVRQGDWNASTNTPTLASAVGTAGHYYRISVAGTTALDGITDWKVGDHLYFGTDSAWHKIDSDAGKIILTHRSQAYYYQLPNITTQGRPVEFVHSFNETGGNLLLWPVPDAVYTVELNYVSKFTERNAATDLLEVPDHWEDAVVLGLEARLLGDRPSLAGTAKHVEAKALAKDAFDIAATHDAIRDGGTYQFAPEMRT